MVASSQVILNILKCTHMTNTFFFSCNFFGVILIFLLLELFDYQEYFTNKTLCLL